MANSGGVCVICGANPTVKAHLFPRALMLDLRDGEKSLVEGSRHRDGVRYRQNGTWDDRYLCKKHEDECGAGDDYAVEFCRRLSGLPRPNPSLPAIEIANPKPHLLVHFAYSMVWRQVASFEGRELGLDLGPYRQVIEAAIFAGGEQDLQVLIGRSNLVMNGQEPARVAIAPYRQRMGDWRVWHFSVGGLDAYVKTDQRKFPSAWDPFLANVNDPLIMPTIQPLELGNVPMLAPTFKRMRTRPERGSETR